MHREHRPVVRPHEQWIAEENIHLRHEQGGEHACQVVGAFVELHHEKFAVAERNIMLAEKFRDAFGITHNHPPDGGFRGILDAECQDDHMALVEELDDFQEGSDFVVKKNRKLPHLRGAEFLGGRQRHVLLVGINEAEIRLVPLDQLQPHEIPSARIGHQPGGSSGTLMKGLSLQRVAVFIEERDGQFPRGRQGGDRKPVGVPGKQVDLEDLGFSRLENPRPVAIADFIPVIRKCARKLQYFASCIAVFAGVRSLLGGEKADGKKEDAERLHESLFPFEISLTS